MTKRLLSLILCCCFTTSLLANNDQPKNEQLTLVFGVVPQQSAKTLAAKWGPVLRRLSQASGIQLKFSTAKNIPTFEKRLSEGKYDIAYMNPYHFIVYNQTPGYQALVKEKDKLLQGIIVLNKNSDVTSLEDLEQADVAFPAPAAFAATMIPQAHFDQLGVNITPRYVYSHDSVYLNVSRRFSKAGGGLMRTLNNTPKEIRDELRIIWRSDGYTPHAIATHPRVSEPTRQRLREAFDTLQKDDSFVLLLQTLNFQTFEEAENQDWDSIKNLGISGQLAKPLQNN